MCTELFRESVAVWKWHFISRSLISQWDETLHEKVFIFFMKLLIDSRIGQKKVVKTQVHENTTGKNNSKSAHFRTSKSECVYT